MGVWSCGAAANGDICLNYTQSPMPPSSKSTPTDADYRIGQITRYFTQIGNDTSQPLYDVNEVYSGPRDRVFGRKAAARNQYRTPIKRPPGMKINSKKVQYYMQQSFEPKFALAEESLLYPSIFGKMHSGIICPFPCQMVNGVCECD